MGSTFCWFAGLISSTGLIGLISSTGCIGFIRFCVFLYGTNQTNKTNQTNYRG